MDKASQINQLMNRLRLRQVALLLAIDATGTLSMAARDIGMTQPAATKMLSELEGALGQKLFDRVGRELKLNASGQRALQGFRCMRGTLEQLQRELHDLRLGSAGQLAVGSIMAASPSYLTGALARLKEQHPLMAVRIEVGTSDRLMELLDAGELDVVIGRIPGAQGNYRFQPLSEEAISVVCASTHPLATARAPSFERLLDHPWVLQPSGSPLRDVIDHEFAAHHAPLPPGLLETSSTLITVHLVSRTRMLAVLPQSVAREFKRHKLLGIVKYQPQNKLASYGSVVRRDRPTSPQSENFLRLLHEERTAD